MSLSSSDKPRVLVLATAHSYRLEAFRAAADRMGVEIVRGIDAPPAHISAGADIVRLDFRDQARSVRQVMALAARRPIQAVIPTDDTGVVLAAQIGAALGLRHNSPLAAEAARNKHRMRTTLAAAGLPSPWFKLFSIGQAPAAAATEVEYPCVLKPTGLSGSRGVIRANDPAEFAAAFKRAAGIIAAAGAAEMLVEGYIPGRELALEGLLSAGTLQVLALFDKPDPLEGPYFEETIYVTPSRESAAMQAAIADCVASAARALGLSEGAVHAEVRVNDDGPWLIELAGRSIGGLCAQTLRFAHNADVTLEELILRRALRWDSTGMEREARAGGVMMIPIPAAGTLLGWEGLEAAQAMPGIESIEVTARANYPVVPLPEGESYLGFIFAR
ncbi:MAG: ATP-grasp domain-containing protein, partial [Anaerolineales bacterium]